jgi:hypothetical protein
VHDGWRGYRRDNAGAGRQSLVDGRAGGGDAAPNAAPHIAIRARHNPMPGVTALVADGPIRGALWLCASLFNIFVSASNLRRACPAATGGGLAVPAVGQRRRLEPTWSNEFPTLTAIWNPSDRSALRQTRGQVALKPQINARRSCQKREAVVGRRHQGRGEIESALTEAVDSERRRVHAVAGADHRFREPNVSGAISGMGARTYAARGPWRTPLVNKSANNDGSLKRTRTVAQQRRCLNADSLRHGEVRPDEWPLIQSQPVFFAEPTAMNNGKRAFPVSNLTARANWP